MWQRWSRKTRFHPDDRTTERAEPFLGIDNVAAMVLGVFKTPTKAATADMTELRRHRVQTASIARALTVHEKLSAARPDNAFLAGMTPCLEQLVIATATSGVKIPGGGEIDHGQVGACLVGLWGFPDNLVEAIAFHHHPRRKGVPGPSLPTLARR